MVAAISVINATSPTMVGLTNSTFRASQHADGGITTRIAVVFATAELDSVGNWQDSDSDGYFNVMVWLKNVGSSPIIGIEQAEVLFGTPGAISHIPYARDARGGYPSWSYTMENGSGWEKTVTAKFTIHFNSVLTPGTYVVKVITPSGAHCEHYFDI